MWCGFPVLITILIILAAYVRELYIYRIFLFIPERRDTSSYQALCTIRKNSMRSTSVFIKTQRQSLTKGHRPRTKDKEETKNAKKIIAQMCFNTKCDLKICFIVDEAWIKMTKAKIRMEDVGCWWKQDFCTSEKSGTPTLRHWFWVYLCNIKT